jgi:hypothetical protein
MRSARPQRTFEHRFPTDRRAPFFFAGMAALQRSPLLGDHREKLKAWGEGLGITETELLAGLDALLSIALRRQDTQ